jgi:hypothetical protein
MTAEVIQFGNSSVPRTRVAPPCVEDARDAGREAAGQKPMTSTAKNQQLRKERGEVWRNADAVTNYWAALLKFHDAVSHAARHGLREARLHSRDFSDEARGDVLDGYREAVRRQVFTPAPDIAAVNWKRTHLQQASWAGAKAERMEQIITDDLAFLKSHPTRALSVS